MKKIGLIVGFILMLLPVFGEKVSKHMAQEVALQFLSARGLEERNVIQETLEVFKGDVVAFYVINYEPEGWALLAADDRIKPVLAYSLTGKFIFNESLISPETRYWIDSYREQIHSVIKENKLPKNRDWDKLLEANEFHTKSASSSVSPLLSVKWNQTSGWNRFCPEDEDGPGGHAYVGCVAVAMAQAMVNVKYPAAPRGQHSYVHDVYGTINVNYDQELPYQWEEMSLTSSNDENARLLYHCAVSVNMDFGPEGSGSLSSRVVGALKEHFGYIDVKYYKRFESDTEWKNLLKSELDKGNVLVYSGDPGTGDPGHSFNIDGYDLNSYFHFNWGWSGKYDGYYSIDNINPGDDKFNVNQDVVVGISQPYFGPTDIILSDLQVREGLPVGSYVAEVEVVDNSETDIFSFTLDGGPKFPTGRHEAAFYIENDTLKTKFVFDASEKNEYILNIKVTDSDFNEYSEEFVIEILPNSLATSNITSLQENIPDIYFSHTDNAILISLNSNSFERNYVEVFDIRGTKFFSGIITDQRYLINTSGFSPGIYLVRLYPVTNRQGMPYVKKLIVGNQ